LIDDSLSQGNKSGYSFVLTGDAPFLQSPTSRGTPQAIGSSGQRMFCTDQTSVIHYDPPAPVAPTPASSWSKFCHILKRPSAQYLECPGNFLLFRYSSGLIFQRANSAKQKRVASQKTGVADNSRK